jgi:hypothetical protein
MLTDLALKIRVYFPAGIRRLAGSGCAVPAWWAELRNWVVFDAVIPSLAGVRRAWLWPPVLERDVPILQA